jgi:hypothetical protein
MGARDVEKGGACSGRREGTQCRQEGAGPFHLAGPLATADSTLRRTQSHSSRDLARIQDLR